MFAFFSLLISYTALCQSFVRLRPSWNVGISYRWLFMLHGNFCHVVVKMLILIPACGHDYSDSTQIHVLQLENLKL